jgi:hypothetical protein
MLAYNEEMEEGKNYKKLQIWDFNF